MPSWGGGGAGGQIGVVCKRSTFHIGRRPPLMKASYEPASCAQSQCGWGVLEEY